MNPCESNLDTRNDLTFEAALAEIQQVLDDLENGAIGLEESLQRFERGTALLRRCHALLESAERRIELVTGRTADGQLLTAPFDSAATHQPEQPQAGRRRRRTGDTPPPVEEPPAESGASLF
jgi:exodeoxyribonuclease VII small subunit